VIKQALGLTFSNACLDEFKIRKVCSGMDCCGGQGGKVFLPNGYRPHIIIETKKKQSG
jgi:hypothetical protein